MYINYDDEEKVYQFTDQNGKTGFKTKQELYEFHLFNEHELPQFDTVVADLDSGKTVSTDVFTYGFSFHRKTLGRVTIRKVPKSNILSQSCKHEDKYINQVFTTKFWYCPKCKSDLGNA